MHRLTLVVPLLLMMNAAMAQGASSMPDAPAATEKMSGGTVLVVGQRPGPGLWKVVKGDHVLWIFGSYSPLPKNMQWRSQQVESVIAQSQEFIASPKGGVTVGFFNGLTLLPHVFNLRSNPDNALLKDIVPADVYARWTALKLRYLGNDDDVERLRPMFAGIEVFSAGLKQSGLSSGPEVDKAIAAMAKKYKVKPTTVYVAAAVNDPSQLMKDFKKSTMDDVACFSHTLNALETDIDAMRVRANAWAKGDLAVIEKLSYAEREDSCRKAMINNSAFKKVAAMQDIRARVRDAWLVAAENALFANKSTFAVLPMSSIVGENSYVGALEAKGYRVDKPD